MIIIALLALYTYLLIGLYYGVKLSCITAYEFTLKYECNCIKSVIADFIIGATLTTIIEVSWLPIYIVTRDKPYNLKLVK